MKGVSQTKKGFILGIILLVPGMLFSQSASWKTYNGELFFISYPGEWFGVGGIDAIKMFSINQEPDKRFDGALLTEQEVDLQKFSPELFLQMGVISIMMGTLNDEERQREDYYEEVFGSMEPGLTNPSRGQIMIDGLPGYYLTGDVPDKGIVAYVAMTIVGEEGFVFMGMQSKEREPDVASFMEKVIDTVGFGR